MKFYFMLLMLALMSNLSTAAQTGNKPANVIDGAKNPELIPQLEAYKSLFTNLAEGPSPGGMSFGYSYLKPANLSKEEMNIVIRASNRYKLSVDEAGDKMIKLKKENPTRPYPQNVWNQFYGILSSLDVTAEELRRDIERDISLEAFQKLDRLVETKVKSSMEFIKGNRQQ